VGKHCPETERLAESAERQAVRIKQVAYMANQLGEEYTGVISGAMPFGFFVRLDNMGAEGLVRMSSIDDDYYKCDESRYQIVGRRTGKVYRLGDSVKVGVLKVDKVRNEIDLYLVRQQHKRTKERDSRVDKRTLKRSRKGRKRRK
jgi:ribonuclease R